MSFQVVSEGFQRSSRVDSEGFRCLGYTQRISGRFKGNFREFQEIVSGISQWESQKVPGFFEGSNGFRGFRKCCNGSQRNSMGVLGRLKMLLMES